MNGDISSNTLSVASVILKLKKHELDEDEIIDLVKKGEDDLSVVENNLDISKLKKTDREIFRSLVMRSAVKVGHFDPKSFTDLFVKLKGVSDTYSSVMPEELQLASVSRTINAFYRLSAYLSVRGLIDENRAVYLNNSVTNEIRLFLKKIVSLYDKVEKSDITLYLFMGMVEDAIYETTEDVIKGILSSEVIINEYINDPTHVFSKLSSSVVLQISNSVYLVDALMKMNKK